MNYFVVIAIWNIITHIQIKFNILAQIFRREICKHIQMIKNKISKTNTYNSYAYQRLSFDYIIEEIDPEITGTIAEIARIIGKTDDKRNEIIP